MWRGWGWSRAEANGIGLEKHGTNWGLEAVSFKKKCSLLISVISAYKRVIKVTVSSLSNLGCQKSGHRLLPTPIRNIYKVANPLTIKDTKQHLGTRLPHLMVAIYKRLQLTVCWCRRRDAFLHDQEQVWNVLLLPHPFHLVPYFLPTQ